MLRLIIFGGICYLAYQLYRRSQIATPTKPEEPVEQKPEQPMRQCMECGVHQPEDECTQSLNAKGEPIFFCCSAHQILYLERHAKDNLD